MNATATERISELFAHKAGLDVAQLQMDATFVDIGLDSLHLMEIALWMKKEYSVDIQDGELDEMRSVREAVTYLVERGQLIP
jgi:acyl carrier protein